MRVLVCLLALVLPQDELPSIFNGKDLAGWEAVAGSGDCWEVRDGKIICKGGKGGWLCTKEEYGDFEMRFDPTTQWLKLASLEEAARIERPPSMLLVGERIEFNTQNRFPGMMRLGLSLGYRPVGLEQHDGTLNDLVIRFGKSLQRENPVDDVLLAALTAGNEIAGLSRDPDGSLKTLLRSK